MSMKAMLGLMDSLSRTVESLRWTPSATLWSTYADHLNYSDAASHKKQLIVAQWLDFITTRSQVRTVWDMGANVGTYSLLAAERTSGLVVSFDLDHAAVEHHYAVCRKRADTRVLPLLQDLANPSASLGWHHMERQSLIQRGPADVALALALIHHLAISGNVPLPSIAAFFAQLSRYLLVEFVPKEDSQLQRMLASREDVFTDYSEERFIAAFQPLFEIVHTAAIEGTVRTLYLMKSRS
jgi:ribosomal protein L11 methylase PrmA